MGWSSSFAVRFALGGAAALVLAGCASNIGGSGSEGAAGSSERPSAIVAVAPVDGTDVLVDSTGRTLYTADVEIGGRIRCVGACTADWAPILATPADVRSATDETGGSFGLVQRPDGTEQLTFGGRPLYSFADDGIGQDSGDGLTGDFQGTHFVWSAVSMSGPSKPAGMQNRDQQGGGYGY
jgi:predicted lipoprotein with Yx(FWY)xxD motif